MDVCVRSTCPVPPPDGGTGGGMVLLGMLEQAGVEVRPLAGWHSATRPSDWTRCGWGCQGVLVGLRC